MNVNESTKSSWKPFSIVKVIREAVYIGLLALIIVVTLIAMFSSI